jgi:hypothetical protein
VPHSQIGAELILIRMVHGEPARSGYESPDRVGLAIASAQFGMISRAQALAAGISRSAIETRVGNGVWQRILPGVFKLFESADPWRQRLTAGYLWAGGVVSHRAAALIWGMDGFDRAPVELSSVRSLVVPVDWIILHRNRVGIAGCLHAGFPITSAEKTLLDLGEVVRPPLVEEALESALRMKLTSIRELNEVVEVMGGSGKGGTATLRKLLDERPDGIAATESRLEVRVERLLKAAGLAPDRRQFEIRDEAGFVARVDFAYPREKVAIEADGYSCAGFDPIRARSACTMRIRTTRAPL